MKYQNTMSKKIKSGIFLFLVALILELGLSNFSALSMRGVEKQVLSEYGETDESGCYETPTTEIQGEVKNVFLQLETYDTEYAEVTIVLTDEGDKYEYALPVVKVFPQINDTAYINIYPYGEVNTITVLVNTSPQAKVLIQEVSVNAVKPFSFHKIRFIGIFGLLIFLYLLREKSCMHNIFCRKGSKGQFVVSTIIVLSVLLVGFALARSNPACVKQIWSHHNQYQELAQSLAKGEVALSLLPDERLVNSENPYDTIALQVEGIPFHMDYAYFDGSYYVYFGIVPELMFYFPYYLLTGQNFPNWIAGYLLYAFFVIGSFCMVWEMVQRYGKKVPYLHYLLLSLSVTFFSQFVFMVARPDLYNIPVLAANSFTVWGIWGWLKALNTDKRKAFYYLLGSLAMALVAGCRPQMLLYSGVALVFFYSTVVKERTLFSKKSWKETVCFILPYGLVAGLVFWYNKARFGSGFDFGATYSLTSNDMSHRGFNLERLWNGVYSFLFQPPTTQSSFPFLVRTNLDLDYMGKNITEFTFGGVFATNLLLFSIIFILLLRKGKSLRKEGFPFLVCMTGASLIIAMFDVNGAGILQRYMGDMVLGFVLASTVVWIHWLSKENREQNYFMISKVFTVLFLCGIMYSFFMVFAKGDSVNLMSQNPQLYYGVAELFSF